MKNMKLTKWHKFVVYKISCFAECEILPKVCEISKSFAKISPHAKGQRLQNTKLCHLSKKLSTDLFVSDDPCVYEPVCYEMMVGKEYYAKFYGYVLDHVYV